MFCNYAPISQIALFVIPVKEESPFREQFDEIVSPVRVNP